MAENGKMKQLLDFLNKKAFDPILNLKTALGGEGEP
jgi:hypothetical protein